MDLWMFMDVYGCLWLFMAVYGCLWMFMDVYGIVSMDLIEFSWIYIWHN